MKIALILLLLGMPALLAGCAYNGVCDANIATSSCYTEVSINSCCPNCNSCGRNYYDYGSDDYDNSSWY